jgi:glycosyltransferase involved in cell wall biosynthesis
MTRVPLLYILHSGNLYGTERMALATLEGLADQFDCAVLSPPGPVQEEAVRLGFRASSFSTLVQLSRLLHTVFASSPAVAVIATAVSHSLAVIWLNKLYNRRLAHLHVVHGGTDERLSYGRKRLLRHSASILVAVSDFVKQRLLANGSAERNICVIENFLPESRTRHCRQRPPFSADGVRNLLVVSRIDPIKRVDLLISAIVAMPALRSMRIRILGTGWDFDKLRTQSAELTNIDFVGFSSHVEEELANADLLVHLCPCEPFGLAILEGIAARVPVLVPDAGGAGSLVEENVTGFHFRADDVQSLAGKLLQLGSMQAVQFNRVVESAGALLRNRFAPASRVADYRNLLEMGLL